MTKQPVGSAVPQTQQVLQCIALLEAQGLLPKPKTAKPAVKPNQWTAHFIGAEPTTFEAASLVAAHTMVMESIDQWYTDNPQPNGVRPLSLLVIERGDTR